MSGGVSSGCCSSVRRLSSAIRVQPGVAELQEFRLVGPPTSTPPFAARVWRRMPKPTSQQSSTPSSPQPPTTTDSPAGCLLRLLWLGAGNVALVFLALLVFRSRRFSALDVAFWAVVALLAGARYLDITRFQGRTADGEPATVAHLRRYLITMLLVAAGAWLAAHALGRLVR